MPGFARHAKTYAKPKIAKELDNDFFISLTKEIHEGLKTPSVSRKEVLAAIESGRISPGVVEDLEDALLGCIIEERLKDSESVSPDEVLSFLRQR